MIDSIITSSLDAIKSKVEIYDTEGTPVTECTCADALSDFTVYREGIAGKLFGFGVCHRLQMNLIDLEKKLNFSRGYYAQIYYGNGTEWDRCYPKLYFDEITVDMTTGDIAIVAYDKLKKASELKYEDLGITETEFDLGHIVTKIETALGLPNNAIRSEMTDIKFTEAIPPNYAGNEAIREVIDDAAEVSGCFYYLDRDEHLIFRKLYGEFDSSASLLVSDDMYYHFEEGKRVYLSQVYAANELNDSVGIRTCLGVDYEAIPVIQYIRNNQLLALRDSTEVKEILLANFNGKPMSMTPFVLDWAGDYRLEIFDDIRMAMCIHGHILINDVVTYNGTYSQVSSWDWVDNGAETDENALTASDKINQTVAKVDKVNQKIELVVNDVTEQSEKLSQLEVTTAGISASVSSVEKSTTNSIKTLNETVESLSKEVNLAITQEEVTIAVQKAVSEGVNKVVTSSKKYTFDDTGLSVSSPDSNISTTITEDGVRIYRNSNEVLTADNEGVKAEDLHATTYLIIGENSRLEDWQNGTRTACFWIGG